MAPELIEEIAHRFALLGDPTRLRILHALIEDGEMSVGAIAEVSGASRFNASGHLGKLAAAGLVARRHVGTSVLYRVEEDTLPRVCSLMCDALRARAASVAALA